MKFKLTKIFIRKILKPILSNMKTSYLQILDLGDKILGKEREIPPRSMIFIGDGDFSKIGQEFLNYFIELVKLKNHHRVLDIGCGIGRMAIPLTKYLDMEGEYYGFDIVQKGINWCKKNITPKYPNFHFQLADVYNKMYNPNGKFVSSEYAFPFTSEYFDFAFLTSVFTHMYSNDIENYLKEISRVLKPGGKCLITFFLLNKETEDLMKQGKSSQNLIHRIDAQSFTTNLDMPESAIGFNEEYITNLFRKNSLEIIKPIKYGSWCGRRIFTSYQDMVIAIKNGSNI